MIQKFNILYLFFFSILLNNIIAQHEIISPKFSGKEFKKIHFFNEDNGIIMTSNNIIKTKDGGISWETKLSNSVGLNDFYFLTNGFGIVVGENESYFISYNYGETWEAKRLNNDYSFSQLTKVYILNNNTIFLITNSGRVLRRSADGGGNWEKVFEFIGLGDLDFRDEISGMLVGNYGQIYNTNDSGKTWERNKIDTVDYYYDVEYFDENNYYLVGIDVDNFSFEAYKILKKDVQENKLTEIFSYPEHFKTDMRLQNNLWVVADSGKVFYSHDLGNSWQDKSINTNEDLKRIFVSSNNKIYASGVWDILYKSNDNGNNWTQLKSSFSERILDYHSFNENEAILYDGSFYKTFDGGESWTSFYKNLGGKVDIMNDGGIKVFQTDANTITTYYSNDRGNTWNKYLFTGDNYLGGLEFYSLDSLKSWFYNNEGKIGYTMDGGRNWSVSNINIPPFSFFVPMNLKFEKNGKGTVIATDFSQTYCFSSEDNGKTWSGHKVGENIRNFIGDFFDENNGVLYNYIINYNASLYLTTDGGVTWQSKSVPLESVSKIKMFSENEIWILGANGLVIKSQDKGDNWDYLEKVIDNTLRDIIKYSDNIYYIIGDNGTIIKYENGISFVISNNESKIYENFYLDQNYPNPFNPSTIITYSIPQNEFVTLKVYDILGKEISTLVNENKSAGKYSVEFKASNLPSGTYIYKLTTGNYSVSKKMSFVK